MLDFATTADGKLHSAIAEPGAPVSLLAMSLFYRDFSSTGQPTVEFLPGMRPLCAWPRLRRVYPPRPPSSALDLEPTFSPFKST
jgi:hypothetical protein